MIVFDPRIILILSWLALGLYGSALAYKLYRRRRALSKKLGVVPYNRQEVLSVVRLSLQQEVVASKASVQIAKIYLVTGLSVVVLGIIAIAPDLIPLIVRQWVSTLCILWFAVAFVLAMRNHATEDKKLAELADQVERNMNGGSHDRGN